MMPRITAEAFTSDTTPLPLPHTVPVRVYGLLGHSGFMTITMEHDALIRKDGCIAHKEQRYRIVSVLKLREGEYCVNVVPEAYNL
ncbi:MAG: hypothetical protein CL923_04005 [Deltaproteobacteria bacterium]|jgi:hypothetical protein|nr:hypothetical protein [Deltaproteobacteria bacterium]|tara:strand:- start:30 stop:284 length:255 start_codon:yes stop_codon:yes gene_type:complete